MLDGFGSIDVWVNNVGVGAVGYFWDIPIEDHALLVDVNLEGLIYGAHAALRVFRSQGHGTLVNVGWVDSAVPIALRNTYAATKAAARSLGHSLSEELCMAGDDDIKVGTVMPWAVDTPGGSEPGQHGRLRRHPRTDGRRGLPLTRFDGVGRCHLPERR